MEGKKKEMKKVSRRNSQDFAMPDLYQLPFIYNIIKYRGFC